MPPHTYLQCTHGLPYEGGGPGGIGRGGIPDEGDIGGGGADDCIPGNPPMVGGAGGGTGVMLGVATGATGAMGVGWGGMWAVGATGAVGGGMKEELE